jgi:signal transduction histidine kinase
MQSHEQLPNIAKPICPPHPRKKPTKLFIKDNGLIDLENIKKVGLTSMRERAELSGGTFEIESTVGKGTIIKASWPI